MFFLYCKYLIGLNKLDLNKMFLNILIKQVTDKKKIEIFTAKLIRPKRAPYRLNLQSLLEGFRILKIPSWALAHGLVYFSLCKN